MAKEIKRENLCGKYVTLREVSVDDADFILALRCDEKKARFLNKINNDKNAQVAYIKRYLATTDEWYFISESKDGRKLGAIRIYDLRSDSFSFGSWVMIDGVTMSEAFETDYLTRMYGFNVLGFNKNHFDVRKDNEKVLKYHQFLGAKKVGETELCYLYEVTKNEFVKRANLMWKLSESK
ncbi:MAG: GNAT family N-acetyltransferase [Clostridiales bacterium]|nr:GNAT family N-acetyltransferase [Clostridiales bacterium]